MRAFLRFAKWGGFPVSIALWVIGTYQLAGEAAMWSVPTWTWLSLGFVVFASSSVSVIWGLWQENKSLKRSPEVELVYDEHYRSCREEVATIGIDDFVITKTVYRVGVRVRGIAPVEDIEVLPLSFRKASDEEQPQLAASLPLRPMHVKEGEPHKLTVNPGQVPAYYVDVLEHHGGSSAVQICYHAGSGRYVGLDVGIYNYSLLVRARNARESVKILMVVVDMNGNLALTMGAQGGTEG